MSAGKMPASGNPPTPTPELLRCNAKVIRRIGSFGWQQQDRAIAFLSLSVHQVVDQTIRVVTELLGHLPPHRSDFVDPGISGEGNGNRFSLHREAIAVQG